MSHSIGMHAQVQTPAIVSPSPPRASFECRLSGFDKCRRHCIRKTVVNNKGFVAGSGMVGVQHEDSGLVLRLSTGSYSCDKTDAALIPKAELR